MTLGNHQCPRCNGAEFIMTLDGPEWCKRCNGTGWVDALNKGEV